MQGRFRSGAGANDSSAISHMLRPDLPAAHATDFVGGNRRRIAAIEEEAAARKALAEMPSSPPKAAAKYEHVTSRLADAGAISRPAKVATSPEDEENTARNRSARAGKASAASAIPTRFERAEIAPRKPSVPKRTEALPKPTHEARDFVGMNARGAESPASPASGDSARAAGDGTSPARASTAAASVGGASGGAGGGRRADYGAVPRYLRERQAEWAAAEAAKAAAAAAADVPAGMRIMPDAERLEMLAMLRSGIEEARGELAKFKLIISVPSHARRKAELEGKLAQMEEAIGVFSRERVLVKLARA